MEFPRMYVYFLHFKARNIVSDTIFKFQFFLFIKTGKKLTNMVRSQ